MDIMLLRVFEWQELYAEHHHKKKNYALYHHTTAIISKIELHCTHSMVFISWVWKMKNVEKLDQARHLKELQFGLLFTALCVEVEASLWHTCDWFTIEEISGDRRLWFGPTCQLLYIDVHVLLGIRHKGN